MNKQTQTIQTAYGETTIETYECDSCGNTVPYDDTVEFVIGDREGRACEHCEANGPISVPAKVASISLPNDTISIILWFPVFVPFMYGITLLENDDYSNGFATAISAVLVWGIVACLFALIVV